MYVFEASVIDVAQVLDQFGNETVACLKLNIEGGEYKVLMNLSNQIHQSISALAGVVQNVLQLLTYALGFS